MVLHTVSTKMYYYYYYHGKFVLQIFTTNTVVNGGYCNKTMVNFFKRLPGCCTPKGETLAYFFLTDLLRDKRLVSRRDGST